MHVRVRVHVQGHCTTCCGGERICCRSLPHIETAVVVMIVRSAPPLYLLFFSCSGSIVPAIFPKILFAVLVSIGACLLNQYSHHLEESSSEEYVTFNYTGFTAFGVSISIFLGFRNSACYDR